MKFKVKVSHTQYGRKGERITVLNKDGTIGAIIYVDKNGKVHCDSWINYNLTSKKNFDIPEEFPKKHKEFNPSSRWDFETETQNSCTLRKLW